MKKIIILLLVLTLSFSLIGCGVVEKDEPNEDKVPSSSDESEKENNEETGEEQNYLAQSDEIKNIQFKRVNGEALLTEEDIENVAVGYDEDGGYYLYIKFTTNGATKLATVTAENVGNIMQITTGDEVITSATINEAITGGELLLTGIFDRDEIMQFFNTITK